eukprot:8446329-Pyramimonas_sp.AAC.1
MPSAVWKGFCNPTSPLGVSGLGDFRFHPPYFLLSEGATSPAALSPGPGRGVSRPMGASEKASAKRRDSL